MARYLLDTDICIYVQRRRSARALKRFAALQAGEAAMSAISLGELMFGAMKSRDQQTAIETIERFASLIPIEPLPLKAAMHYGVHRARLEQQGRIIGSNDLWIAAHALAGDLTLVTNNEREFRRIEGLRVENWGVGARVSRTRADLALVERGLFPSRAKAREAIEAGLVSVDGRVLAKASDDLSPDAQIEARAPYPWVSRGGVKLAAALDYFGIDPADRLCLDIGASTGGFTHVLLARRAKHVVAVDVGQGQFHASLAADPRVTPLEKTDARRLDAAMLGGAPSLIVVDVSFISLALVLPHVLNLVAIDATLVALIKPQFEVGPERVKKGIVRDEADHAAACEKIAALVVTLGWQARGLMPSPIEGGGGNREFLIAAHRSTAP
jgi:23S rRNA (cytidine1920-2'-O)/16S rRNA (cytidine1409-2'-O)-methyltransferase